MTEPFFNEPSKVVTMNLLQDRDPDTFFMKMALREAEKAYDAQEVPVGCVIVHNKKVIAKAYNQRETLKDPTAHAEIIAITQAAAVLEAWRLIDATLYVTLEPCCMCAGALVNSRISRVVFGTTDPKGGACGSLFNIANDPRLNHRLEITQDILKPQCAGILQDFFRMRRENKND